MLKGTETFLKIGHMADEQRHGWEKRKKLVSGVIQEEYSSNSDNT
jgi:hypothetical protein